MLRTTILGIEKWCNLAIAPNIALCTFVFSSFQCSLIRQLGQIEPGPGLSWVKDNRESAKF